jgi:hydrogenase-4 component B
VRAVLLLTALALMAFGAAASLLTGTGRRPARLVTFWAAAAASALTAAVGVLCVLGVPRDVGLSNLLDFGRTSLRFDPLAGMFLTLTGSLGALVSLALAGSEAQLGQPGERVAGVAYLQLLASVTVVMVAGDVFTFLFAWESMTTSLYLLSAASRRRRAQPADAWVTAGLGKVGGASLLVGFLLLAGTAGSFQLAAWRGIAGGALHDVAYGLVVFGFGTKVGVVPFQVWMPKGYSAAPGPMRAAMAGVAVNAGFYGLWRSLALLGRPPEWLAAAVLVLGGLTALLGVAFVAVENDLARAVAFSSVENGGVILVGFGVALSGAYVGSSALVAVGLLAASLQVLTHALAKTGLFLAVADFEATAGTTQLERLAGMARSRPWASVCFAACALALAGLPPTVGLVSEWFVLESLMQQFRLGPLVLRLTTAAAGALVALTVGVAALSFVRLVAFTVLGRPKTELGPASRAVPTLSKLAYSAIAMSCFGVAAVAPWAVRFIAKGLDPAVARRVTLRALKSPWVLQPVFGDFSALSPSWLAVVLPVGFLAVAAFTVLASRGRFLSVRRVPAWRSATPGVHGEDSYSAFAFANAARHVLANILGTEREVALVEAPEEGEELGHRHVLVTTRVTEPAESYLYRPAIAVYLAAVRAARRLQSGRLEAYVTYMLLALVAVLVVAAAT